ncbi:MAG TPA: carboxypeptidase-like regulatory domain-containing protein, partial [Acidimicrobiia bacterium]|nr:carboxypeptidase-like regulatory domain-containing protein [Acidimicrobiia bacterium]
MKRNPARRAALVAAALVLSSSVVPSFGARPAAASGAPGRLAGVVRDETGAVLAGAQVRLTTPGGPVAAEGDADAAGRYSIDVAPGLYDMTVVAGDDAGPWTAFVKNMAVWSDTPLDFAVVRPAAPAATPADPADAAPGGTGPGDTPGDGLGAPGEADAPDVTWTGRIVGPGGEGVE